MSVLMIRGGAQLDKTRGDAIVLIDDAEHQRRQEAGLGALREVFMLDSMLHLPYGVCVPLGLLHERDRSRFDRLPDAAVQVTPAGAVRHVRPALEVIGAQVSSGPWERQLRWGAELARFTTTSIVMKSEPNAFQLSQADFLGVGVIVRTAAAERTVLDPVAPPAHQVAVQWLFDECAYAAYLHLIACRIGGAK